MATTTTITGAQFDAMPYEEGRRWELVNGDLISVSSPTPRHQDIVFEILLAVRRYLRRSGIAGRAYQEVEFALTENDRVRPDVGVVIGEKATRLNPDKVPISGASGHCHRSHLANRARFRKPRQGPRLPAKRDHGSVAGLPKIANRADPSRRDCPLPRMEPAGGDRFAARFRTPARVPFRHPIMELEGRPRTPLRGMPERHSFPGDDLPSFASVPVWQGDCPSTSGIRMACVIPEACRYVSTRVK